MTASCDYQDYGQLTAYVTPTRNATAGPAVVNSKIQSNTKVSQYVTLVGRAGSTVSLGTTLIIPIDDSVLYVRPLYVSSSQNPYPQLTRYIVVYGNDVAMENTLGAALADVFGAATSNIGTGTATSRPRSGPSSRARRATTNRARGAEKRRPDGVLRRHEDRRQPHRRGGDRLDEGPEAGRLQGGQSRSARPPRPEDALLKDSSVSV